MKNIEDKREKEKRVVGLMIDLYCKSNHHQKKLCQQCADLKEYAYERILNNQNIDDSLNEFVLEKYPDEFKIVKDILDQISKKYNVEIPENEIAYLTIHFKRISKENN